MGFFLTKKVKQDGTEGERDEQARQAQKNPTIWHLHARMQRPLVYSPCLHNPRGKKDKTE